MERRKFVKTGAAVAGLMASVKISPLLSATEKKFEKKKMLSEDNRPAEYLQRVQKSPFLPKQPAAGKSYPISPMPLAQRVKRKIVPQRGFCSITPGGTVNQALTSGNGAMNIELMGEPYAERILFNHERLLMPWKKPLEAPDVAKIFPQVRQLILDGKTKDAIALAFQQMNETPIKPDTEPHLTIPAFLMKLDLPKAESVYDYLRTVNFENGEITVHWTDDRGRWIRRTFASRPDNAVAQLLVAPQGKSINVRISLEKSAEWSMCSGMDWGAKRGIGTTEPDMNAFTDLAVEQKKYAPKGVDACDVQQDSNEHHMVYKCRLDPSVDHSGYAGVTRVVRSGGSAKMDGNSLVIENASSVLLLTRIDYFSDYSEDNIVALQKAVDALTPDYTALLERHEKIHSEMFNRVTIDFGGASQYGMSTEELLADQHSRADYSPALLEKIFGMGRHWFILNSGAYPSIASGINSTIDLQTAGAVQGDLREGMEAYFKWMEEIAPDCRTNAKNIFGCRGTSYPLFPDKGFGVNFYYTPNTEIGVWPYWISAGGWRMRPFWEHYLVTGDAEFLRHRVMPAYKELAEFYEEFLTVTDNDGKFIFVPSISPENTSRIKGQSGPGLINASMDIAVCREVLSNLIHACELLGTDTENVKKWKAMITKLPPYLLEVDGTLKEWAWPAIEEHYSHRHLSHLYGAWPGDEIDPDRTSQLARAAEIANRRRTFDTMPNAVAGETLAAYGRCHRALVGARLKDSILVDIQLRQLIEQGYVSTALRCSREPYSRPVPDAQSGIPAIIMEMLAYSRPGVIEVLPALPLSLKKGSINGMLARTFVRINTLAWDLEKRTVDLSITSIKKQDLTLIARYGLETISATSGVLGAFTKGSADCELHLPENKRVELHLKIGNRTPLDWIDQVA
ncbi:MAG TPA: glycoside hydrolase N-terminal domain-containing protein [Bacteroidota bacterium]|nr:glycoside hydrolase N-terminal domain-containing protein [Bacteroidota bacterium]